MHLNGIDEKCWINYTGIKPENRWTLIRELISRHNRPSVIPVHVVQE